MRDAGFELPPDIDRDRLEREVVLDPRGIGLTSRLNRMDVARAGSNRTVIIRDDTLRSGSNTPDVYATIDQKLRIAAKLEEIGVVEAEVGYASVPAQLELVRRLKAHGSRLRLGVHCDYANEGWQDRIETAIDAGADVVNIVGMSGYLMPMGSHPHLSGQAVVERIHEAAEFCSSRGVFTSFLTPTPTLAEYEAAVRAAMAGGADRFYVVDTRGWLTPSVLVFLTTFLRDICGDRMQIGLHCHDDFGMAVANSCEAVAAGADAVDVTALRTGHRCGNAAFEQVVTALESMYGIATGIDLAGILGLCELVAREYGVAIPPNAPIVGEHMYMYGGVHVTGYLRSDWFIWENLRAEAVGQPRHLVYGETALQQTSANPVLAKLGRMGVHTSAEQLDDIFARLTEVIRTRRMATDAELEEIIGAVVDAR
jgi:isopropylmalate/homocitrate/citramalate synthase